MAIVFVHRSKWGVQVSGGGTQEQGAHRSGDETRLRQLEKSAVLVERIFCCVRGVFF